MKFISTFLSSPRNTVQGQASMEYVVVCAALAVALGLGMSDTSVLKELLDAFKTAYEKIAFAMSLPT